MLIIRTRRYTINEAFELFGLVRAMDFIQNPSYFCYRLNNLPALFHLLPHVCNRLNVWFKQVV